MPRTRAAWAGPAAQVLVVSGLRGGSGIFALLVSLALARYSGAELNGRVLVAWAAISVLSTLGALGLPMLMIREFGARRLGALTRREFTQVLVLTAVVASALACVAATLVWNLRPDGSRAFLLTSLCAVPASSILVVLGGAFTGARRAILGEVSTRTAVQVVMLAGVLVVGRADVGDGAFAYVIVATYWSAALAMLLVWATSRVGRGAPEEELVGRGPWLGSLLRRSLPLMLTSCIALLPQWLDVVMLDALVGVGEAGVYGVAVRAAAVIGLTLVGVAAVSGPRFARLHAAGDMSGLRDYAAFVNTWTTLCAGVFAAALISARGLLGTVFGEQFDPGETVFVIACVGQLLHVSFGLVSLLLVMIGRTGDVFKVSLTALAVNGLMNALLIPFWGMTGAAIASLLSILAANTLGSWFVAGQTGVRPLRLRWRLQRDRA